MQRAWLWVGLLVGVGCTTEESGDDGGGGASGGSAGAAGANAGMGGAAGVGMSGSSGSAGAPTGGSAGSSAGTSSGGTVAGGGSGGSATGGTRPMCGGSSGAPTGGAGMAPTAPSGWLNYCLGACPYGECDNSSAPFEAPCASIYPCWVDQDFPYCYPPPSQTYCLQTTDFQSWLVSCDKEGTPSFVPCADVCARIGEDPPMCIEL